MLGDTLAQENEWLNWRAKPEITEDSVQSEETSKSQLLDVQDKQNACTTSALKQKKNEWMGRQLFLPEFVKCPENER